MRILFTASGSHIGGATRALMHLMLGLPSIGVKPILLSTPPRKDYLKLYRRLRERGVELILSKKRFRGALFWIWLTLSSLKAIKSLGIDLVHCHGTKEAAFVGLAAKLLKRRVVYTVEGDPLLEMSFSPRRYGMLDRVSLKILWRLGLSLADLVVGCSRWMAEHLKRYGVEASHIHNPIDYERFSSRSGRGAGRERIIVSVARFEKVKGLDTLIKAAQRVVEEFPDTRFILVGGGSMKEELQRMASRLGVEKNVELIDYTPDVDEILAKASIAVLPSLYEPFGMAAAEAQASGLPVIATKVGGLQEIVRDGIDGFLIEQGDWKGLAEKIVKLLRDPGLRERMSREAKASAERFAPERIASSYLKIYLRVLRR